MIWGLLFLGSIAAWLYLGHLSRELFRASRELEDARRQLDELARSLPREPPRLEILDGGRS